MLSINIHWEIIYPANIIDITILFTFKLLNLYVLIIIFNNIIVFLLLLSTMSRTFKLLSASGKHMFQI